MFGRTAVGSFFILSPAWRNVCLLINAAQVAIDPLRGFCFPNAFGKAIGKPVMAMPLGAQRASKRNLRCWPGQVPERSPAYDWSG